jgi:cyclopropane-fatty-acyl-phospholipid synthase
VGSLGALIRSVLGDDFPLAVRAADGTRIGPADAPATIVVRSEDAIRRIVGAPGELGLARAYVAGDLDLEGDLYAVLALGGLPRLRLAGLVRPDALRLLSRAAVRPLPPPPEEVRLRGRRHTRARDAAAVSHHYDVSNRFYELLLGPSLTYSCAVWPSTAATLAQAQEAKYELVSRKLDLRPGMRLLDVGCGWGGMVLHAASRHGVRAVGITLSREQADLALRRVREADLADRIEIRVQDYRDVTDGPYDAISSIGMVEHVGRARLLEYLERLHDLLVPEGRLLNHGISRPLPTRPAFARRGFINRYVFPDGELHEVGTVVTDLHRVGFEVRHLESLREHYALTLRQWARNLELAWDEAVAEVGERRARVWRLYLAGSALGFEDNDLQIHQALAVRTESGRSGMPLRPRFEELPLVRPAEERVEHPVAAR